MEFFSSMDFSIKDVKTPGLVAGMKYDSFQGLIDAIIFRAWSIKENYGVDKYDFLLKAPFSMLVGDYNDTLMIAFSNNKATIKFSTLSEIIDYKEPASPSIDHFKSAFYDTAKTELGFDDAVFLELNRLSMFVAQEKTIEQLTAIDDSFKRFRQFMISFTSDNLEWKQCFPEFEKSAERLIKDIHDRKQVGTMKVNPIFKARDVPVDENLVFCALPFTKKRLEIFDEVIKPKLEQDFGMIVVRSGNMFKPNMDIMENIWTYINQAKIVIVDISDKNPNVYYELGMCHTLGKETIIICDEASYNDDYDKNLPFDIGRMNTIFYHNTGAGPTNMVADIEKMIQAVKSGSPTIS